MSSGSGELYLRDVLDLSEVVRAGSFKIELSGGFDETAKRVGEYVVTPQLEQALRRALKIVEASVRAGSSDAAYLHGSFGSGKSHFMTVLHAILSNDPAARAKPTLQPIIADHDAWLRDRKFLMVPFHLVGATDLDSAILGGYVRTVRHLHPDAPVPPVYRADAMFDDARRQREFFADDEQFVRWLGNPALPKDEAPAQQTPAADDEADLVNLDVKEAPKVWTPALLDQALAISPDPKVREWLASALLSGPYSSYSRGALGAKNAFLPLENGLDIISRHAKSLGYDGLILFLDELILWLQAHLRERTFVNDEVNKLVKLIESGTGGRALPVVSFISRQRDLSELIGSDAVGAEAKNLEQQVKYLAGRIDPISLEDRNLPEIIKERVLKPKDAAAKAALEAAFARIETSNQSVRDVLLDANGVTHADWKDFKALYPVSPVLLNVLVALSGALQRERTGLKLLQQMLYQRREDMKVGELIPLGDLWDVLAEGMGEAFTDRLRSEAEAATRFHGKVKDHLLEKYGSAEDAKYKADERFVKTMLLAYLAPEVPALTRLTGPRLNALNHGSIRSRTGQEDRIVVRRMQELQAQFPGELRSDGHDLDPVFTLHLSDLDVEPILDSVGEKDTLGARKRWVQEWLWRELKIADNGTLVADREIVWHGTRRTAEFVFENVRDPQILPDAQFEPSTPDRIRLVIDYPFDEDEKGTPSADENRVYRLQREKPDAATVVWLPSFVSGQRGTQLGRLLKINYLLDRDRLKDFATHLGSDDQVRVRHQLEAQRETLVAQLGQVLHQAYGIARANESDLGAQVTEGKHVHALYAGHTPQLQGGGAFEYNLLKLADGLLDAMYPKHPNFDRQESRKPVTAAKFKMAYGWIVKAMNDSSRRVVVDSRELGDLARIVHPLELGEVHDGPLNVSTDWRRHIDQQAGKHGVKGDFGVEDIRTWIAELGWTGLDKLVSNLVIATYALLADRSWVYNGKADKAPALDQIGPGWALRAQERPSEEEYTRAHERAAALFGTSVPTMLNTRNVNALAADVRTKAEAREDSVNGLRRALARYRSALGITGETPTTREQSVRDAADLLARIKQTPEATPLARDLAAATYVSTYFELGKVISSAQEVLDALEDTDWELIDSVRKYTGRGDGLADRSERLLAEIADAASRNEPDTSLKPVLNGARGHAVALINEAARLSTVAPVSPLPPPTVAPDVNSPGSGTGHNAVSPTTDDQPPLPPTPTTAMAASRRVKATGDGSALELEHALNRALTDVQDEIRDYAAAHPDVEIEITWQVLHTGQGDGSNQPGGDL
ncbi:PglY protein [Streptomyces fulvoviolaceus]|uniref:PglY protein n=1 Tax=Streptomyces fulvoviolaceus TaxID=285535 RepID=UPI0021BFC72A|nr:PglY protein [Streptomyces fulvoviolaceus]MCT9080286.1 PglY protein [Streptomyces fulvoviolaceus]